MTGSITTPRPLEGAFNSFLGFMLEALFVLFPMGCMAVVLYDITINRFHSVFAVIGLLAALIWIVFRAVALGMSKYDALVERLYQRRSKNP